MPAPTGPAVDVPGLVPALDAGYVAQPLQLSDRDGNPGAQSERHVLLDLPGAGHGTVWITDEEPDPAARSRLAPQETAEVRLLQPQELVGVASEHQLLLGLADQLPPQCRGRRRPVRVDLNDLTVGTGLDG